MKLKLLDLAVIAATGGLVYFTLKRQKGVEPQPVPEVKKLIKKVATTKRRAGKAGRGTSATGRAIVNDRSAGRHVEVANSDGSTARHVVGRGVRH